MSTSISQDQKDDIPFRYSVCSDYDYNNNNDTANNTETVSNEKDDIIDDNNNDTKSKSTSSSSPASSSSVLDKGVVESRNVTSTKKTREEVEDEIQSFLDAPLSLHREIRTILSIVMFVTRLPVPAGIDIHPGFLMKGMCYFPIVGSFIGMTVAFVFDVTLSTLQLPAIIAACFSTAVGWWLTGCFHEDGLCDSADGIGGGWSREQILKIMTDSRVGTYGCAVFVLYTITKVQLLANLGNSHWDVYGIHNLDSFGSSLSCSGAGPALIASHSLARLTSPYMIHMWNYIDDEQGPKSSFYAFMIQAKYLVNRPRVIFATVFCLVLLFSLFDLDKAAILIASVFLFAHCCGRYAERVLGGVMGDFLGATICLCELVVLSLLLVLQKQELNLTPVSSLLSFLSSQEDHQSSNTVYLTMTNGNFTLQEIMSILREDERVRPMTRFMMLYGVYMTWCYFANSTYDRKEPYQKSGDSPSLDSNISTTSSSVLSDNTEARSVCSARDEATRILSSSTSSFRERYDAVQTYIDGLAKPIGSLGTLENWSARLAAIQRTMKPDVDRVACLIFAGDHGVAAASDQGGEGCSAYPQAVTKSVLVGLERGVAGASVLAKTNDVRLSVVDVGVIAEQPFRGGNVVSSPAKLPNGTKNFCKESAMSTEETERCMGVGRESLTAFAEETKSNIVVIGEVGIGNTTSSSALIAALTKIPVDKLCDGGAFAARELQEMVVKKKIAIVERALAKHYGNGSSSRTIPAFDALAKLGGAEIAAMVGAILEASENEIAVLVDGFIATTAALIAVLMSPKVCHVLFLASRSAERGQQAAIEKIQCIARENQIPVDNRPALSMDLRMGEATAALLAVPILRSSAAVLGEMATIQDILS